MIQVDVFWSFAMGVSFAVSAAEGIKRSQSMLVNKYFVFTLCFLSMIFAPSGIYLLWHHTGWETMYFFDKSLHGIWPCLFAVTNVLNGVVGFCITYSLIKSGDERTPHTLWTSAYTAMFAILTFGYDRFLYAGTDVEWHNGVKYDIVEFFQSQIFYTLLLMAVFVLPPLYYSAIFWPREFGTLNPAGILKRALLSYGCETLIVAASYNSLRLAELLPGGWGSDRLMAFLIGQVAFGIILFLPLIALVIIPPNEPVENQVEKKFKGKSGKKRQ